MALKSAHLTSVRMPHVLADALRAYAVVVGSNVNELINDAAREYLKAHVTETSMEAMAATLEKDAAYHVAALRKVAQL